MILEICTGSLASIHAAVEGGAHRVEVCAALEIGGLTPSQGYLEQALAIQGIRKHVLIRPRGGDFCYSDEEQAAMQRDISLCRQLGADGVVVGALTPEGKVDKAACTRFAEAAEGMSLTFHRAFDVCTDPFVALEQITDMGYCRILTSGQAERAEDSLPLLRCLIERAAGRISIMPGSGVSPDNVARILAETGASEIHASAKGIRAHESPLFPGVLETSADVVAQILAGTAKK